MDLRERFEDAQEALRAAIHGALIDVWTALPGSVQAFDAHALTVTVRPAIQGVVRRLDRETATVRTEAVELPLLGDVPVFFPRGGGCTLTFPVQKAMSAWWCSRPAASMAGGNRAAFNDRWNRAGMICRMALRSSGRSRNRQRSRAYTRRPFSYAVTMARLILN